MVRKTISSEFMVQENSINITKEPPSVASRTLNLDALRSFVAIYETGSFRRAAARVHRSPSAISLQIGKLEDALGVRLMDRNARHLGLTDQGEMLLAQARRILGLNDETIALFQHAPLKGRLCLIAPQDLGVTLVPEMLRRLADVHPGVLVDVRLGTSDSVFAGISDGTANLALFNDVGESALPAQDLFAEPLTWLALDGGRAGQKDPVPLAVAEIGCAWREAALAALDKAGRPYRIAYSSDTSMGQVAAVRADLAVAALPKSLANRDLVDVAAEYDLPKLPMTSIRVADDGSELAKAFVALIQSDLAGKTPQHGLPAM